MDATHLKRVVVVGTSCSGKTTFARSLAQKLNVPHIEMDSIHWGPNWTATPKAELSILARDAVAPEVWVLDGNYSAVRDILWARATLLIWLDYPFALVVWRALSRTCRRVFCRQVLWSGNRENFRHAFLSRDSIPWYVLKTYRRHRKEYPYLFKQPQNRHLQITILDSPAAAKRFLRDIA